MRFTRPLALSAAAALLLTACGEDAEAPDSSDETAAQDAAAGDGEAFSEGEGLGDSEALADLEFHLAEDDDGDPLPELIFLDELEEDEPLADEPSTRILESGDGDQIEEDNIVDLRTAAVNPQDGSVTQHSFAGPLGEMNWLPQMTGTDVAFNDFLHEALTAEGVTEGTDLLIYYPADGEEIDTDQLLVVRFEEQYPVYADGEVQEQSGELPQIGHEIGVEPELEGHDPETEAPEELASEVLIEGDGDEIAADDYIFVQYRGWGWSDGEEFDGSWGEDGEASAETMLAESLEGLVDGWAEGLAGHHVGDRVLLVIPPELGYGDSEGHDLQDETLIFVIDVIRAIDNETYEDLMAEQAAPEQPEMPQLELTDEERAQLEELGEDLGMSADELEMMGQQFGATSYEEIEQLVEMLGEAEGEGAPEEDEAETDAEDEQEDED